MDSRYNKLAHLLVHHSTKLQKDEHVLIESFDIPVEMTIALVRAVREVGAHAHVAERSARLVAELYRGEEKGLAAWGEYDLHRMKKMQAYIGLRGGHNISEASIVAGDQMKMAARLYQKPVHFEQRVNHTKWCVLRWPSASMAQLAGKCTEAFEDFYFKVCCVDYAKMEAACAPLAARMAKTDKVHIKSESKGPGETDLHFSIKNIGVIPCCGDKNVPDGECFTAPVRDSVNGVLHYNTSTVYNGQTFENVRLVFRNGRIVEASCQGDSKKLNEIFDTDEGARYVGEFAIGFNPHITHPMKDILFDEKIAGSFHFTPGRCYEEASNGNHSEIHWDLVCIQRSDFGGGTIAFDGEIVRRDGLFVVDDLKGLNPDRLG
ncbi:MAG: aminopeptidase [Planctomycetota bacterium]|nr:MAG: aminopeptidase [Planctomycetota bacterium]RLS95705.1 MAG: aminopeptidase [Planctomycetota bacterium]